MSSEFSRTLSLLRRERGVSQRTAAGDLGISQALLSHYENGAREPGLSFVCRACDYYGVSADYRDYAGQIVRDIREILARNKDFFTALIQPAPTYGGERIPISGDGDVTNDL